MRWDRVGVVVVSRIEQCKIALESRSLIMNRVWTPFGSQCSEQADTECDQELMRVVDPMRAANAARIQRYCRKWAVQVSLPQDCNTVHRF
ncbi:hypothetical protein C8039_07040 [Halogeometricum sp. wsp3]|nr:hypothetical protein C8039_07040 [Halogeometricum sp. wsp3]